MLDRVLLTIIFHFYRSIVAIDPNTGNELGKKTDDVVNPIGNHSNTIILLRTIVIFVISLQSVYYRLDVPLNALDYIMFVSGTLGLIISYWAYYTLGNFYTFTLGIRKDHKIVSEGPYKYVVHPGYLGQFLIMIASLIFYRVNILFTCLQCLYVIYAFNTRMKAEEEMLTKHFGEAYKTFISKRWRMVPGFELLK